MKNILFGFLGTTLDSGISVKRWQRWRPSVSICEQPDLPIHEYNLIYTAKAEPLAQKVAEDIKEVSPATKLNLVEIFFSDAWDFEEVYTKLLDLIEHYDFNSTDDRYIFNITTGSHVIQICIYLLTESRRFPGCILQSSPQPDHRKGSYSIIDLDISKYDKIAARFRKESRQDISYLKSGIETKNPAFNRLIEEIEVVALRTSDPILLTGPTGAGKSRLARKIYELKRIKGLVKGEFVAIDCGTIRGDSAMSALFGHKKGSFTGALQDRIGLLKTADKGVVFLDEIGELGIDEQAMLLRAVEEKKFFSLGADKESESNFQLICGTNRDLKKRVSEGLFRDDLLSRINLWTFKLPGLSERPEDIEPNLDFELEQFAARTGNMVRFTGEARSAFLNFAASSNAKWSGNFRDLNGAVIRLCTLARGGRITNDILDDEMRRLKLFWGPSAAEMDYGIVNGLKEKTNFYSLDLFDRMQLRGVIDVCRESSSLSDAGRKLFAASRTQKTAANDSDRLKKYLAKFNLSWSDLRK